MKEITLPSDQHLERLVLASMLSSFDAMNEGLSQVTSDDFTLPKHAAIYIAIAAAAKADVRCTPENLIKHMERGQGGRDPFTIEDAYDLVSYLPYGVKFASEALSLRNLTALRRIIYAARDAFLSAADPFSQANDVAAVLQGKLANLDSTGWETKNPSSILKNFHANKSFEEHLAWVMDRVKNGFKPYVGVSSGYPRLDEMIGTFRPQCLYYIGARTSVGKTTFLLNLIRNMTINGSDLSVGFFSLEMPAEIIVKKLMCMFARVNYNHLEDGKLMLNEISRVLATQETIEKMKIYIEDPNSIKLSQLMSRARRMKSVYGIQVLFIDYLTRIRSDVRHVNKHLEVDEISKGLQSLSKELKIPIICLCQLNRAAEGEEAKPNLSHFRESGSIEEDADACFILTRPSKDDKTKKPGLLVVKVAKNRLRGDLGDIDYSWQPGGIYEELVTVQEEVKNLTNDYFSGKEDLLDE